LAGTSEASGKRYLIITDREVSRRLRADIQEDLAAGDMFNRDVDRFVNLYAKIGRETKVAAPLIYSAYEVWRRRVGRHAGKHSNQELIAGAPVRGLALSDHAPVSLFH
jgi:hypothetical protein